MKVILRENVEKLGRAGDVKEVSAGFGRNFLLPRRLAAEATPSALKFWEKGRARREKLAQVARKAAQDLAGRLAGVSLSFSRPAGAEGRIFGSVGKADIVKSLKTCGYEVEKSSVALESAIKTTGEREVELRLHHDVSAKIKVTVVPRE